MTFVFPLLLGGLVLTGIPVLLHLIVRRKPKRLPFPAFRFLVQQRRANLRKLRLRHLLLLALRVFLIAAMCLLLARPRLFHRVLGLDGERPVQAVLLIDTSASMEYRSSDGMTRLALARQRAQELLAELPAGSQVALVDSAGTQLDKLDWLPVAEARKHVEDFKSIHYANFPVSQALAKVLGLLAQPEAEHSDRSGPARLKLVAVLSDRTRGSWDSGQVAALTDKLDRVPPMYEGLLAARGQIGPLRDLLADQPAQALAEALNALQSELVALPPERASGATGLTASVQQVRRLTRELLAQLPTDEASPGNPASGKLRAALGEMLRATSGAQLLYLDVGIDAPVDVTLGALELQRAADGTEQQSFAEGDTFTLNVMVQATGKDAPAKLICQVGEVQQEFDVELKAGQRQLVPFTIGAGKLLLKPGDNPIEVRLAADRAALPHSQHRFATVRARPKRKVIVIADDDARAAPFVKRLAALSYAPEVKRAAQVAPGALTGAAAVYLLGVAAPDENVWRALGAYVKAGGGLAIVPAGTDLSIEAYNQPAAQEVMPGKIAGKLEGRLPAGSDWDWASAKYSHSFLKRFKMWRSQEWTDIVRLPRGALAYWDVVWQPGAAMVLVSYDDAAHEAAVLERLFDAKSAMQGKTLLFTTPLDEQQPPWNNYHEMVSPSFFLGLVREATAYLGGESIEPQLNFVFGRGDPMVALPAGPALELVAQLRGPELRNVPLEAGQSQLVVRDLRAPGNYQLDGKTKDGRVVSRIVAFSVNVSAAEADLSRVPAAEIEPLFTGAAILTPGPDASLHDALQSYRSEPLDLMPYFMLALLFALALENLLANRFYRQPDTA
jgi:hypothetical protein